MELLPDEKILRYLNHFKLRNCLRVCQKWHRVARDNFLWHEIEVSWKKPLNDRVILSTIAHQHPSVHTLVIASHSNTHSRPPLPSSVQIRGTSRVWNRFKGLSTLSTYKTPASFFTVLPSLFSACYSTLTCLKCIRSGGLKDEQFQLLFANPSIRFIKLSIAYTVN